MYTQDNHNSVLGIRELALDHGATATCVEFDSEKGVLPCMVVLLLVAASPPHHFNWNIVSTNTPHAIIIM